MAWQETERVRIARTISNMSYDKTELGGLFTQRRELALQSLSEGLDNSVQIQIINNRIKSLLCL